MTVAMTAKMQDDPELRSNPLAGLGMMMMPAIVGRMVDGFVTPEGMSALMKRGRLKGGKADTQASTNVEYDYQYRSLDRFAVAVKAPEAKESEIPKIVFERRGLFSWKVIRLEIPDSVLDTNS